MSTLPDNSDFDPRLIDLHLGGLSAPQQADLARAIASDANLATQDRVLREAFAALSILKPVPVPADLVQRTRQRAAAAARLRVTVPDDGDWSGVIRMQSFRNVIAVAAMIVLAVGVGVPSLLQLRERHQRIACSANLAQVGRAIQTYALAFGDSLPFVGWSDNATWRPTDDPTARVQPNRRHLFAMVSGGLVSPDAFICAGAGGVPMSIADVPGRVDFLEARNISYAYQNMAGIRPSMRTYPDQPVLGDDNPFFDDGLPLFDLRRLSLGDPWSANSRSHGGSGQNILTIDGRVIWTATPNVGVAGDNIWTLDQVREYTGREGPAAQTDSHLLK